MKSRVCVESREAQALLCGVTRGYVRCAACPTLTDSEDNDTRSISNGGRRVGAMTVVFSPEEQVRLEHYILFRVNTGRVMI